MKKPFLNYLTEAFALTNKAWILIAIAFVLDLSTYFINGSKPTLWILISLVFLMIASTFRVTVPFFLQQKQLNKLKISIIIPNVFSVFKRLLMPLTLTVILVMIIFGIFFALIFISFPNYKNYSNVLICVLAGIVALWSSLEMFFSILFAIEKTGFFNSIKQSFQIALKHKQFLAINLAINLALVTLGFLFKQTQSSTLNLNYIYMLYLFFLSYIEVVHSSLYLLFYQSEVKK